MKLILRIVFISIVITVILLLLLKLFNIKTYKTGSNGFGGCGIGCNGNKKALFCWNETAVWGRSQHCLKLCHGDVVQSCPPPID